MKTYPDVLTNYHPRWLEFNADLETGQLEMEPHQLDRHVGRDFASGSAELREKEA